MSMLIRVVATSLCRIGQACGFRNVRPRKVEDVFDVDAVSSLGEHRIIDHRDPKPVRLNHIGEAGTTPMVKPGSRPRQRS